MLPLTPPRPPHPRRCAQAILAQLREEGDEGAQLGGLTELCEYLSISTEDSLAAFPTEQVVPLLVRMAAGGGAGAGAGTTGGRNERARGRCAARCRPRTCCWLPPLPAAAAAAAAAVPHCTSVTLLSLVNPNPDRSAPGL